MYFFEDIFGLNIRSGFEKVKTSQEGVFGVAEFKFEKKNFRNKMADTKWRTFFSKIRHNNWKLSRHMFSMALIPNLWDFFMKTKWLTQNGGQNFLKCIGFS